jgi:hypothetical protein
MPRKPPKDKTAYETRPSFFEIIRLWIEPIELPAES